MTKLLRKLRRMRFIHNFVSYSSGQHSRIIEEPPDYTLNENTLSACRVDPFEDHNAETNPAYAAGSQTLRLRRGGANPPHEEQATRKVSRRLEDIGQPNAHDGPRDTDE
ncbi:hypothetical protein [Acetobacter orleanensis]|uniref:Uncharacterized protein n=1 Tax=Acetobacter orleanensis TaxID=104099 RepID=A0A4Y3TQG4_9PROT|nr:hypothetical protein [Acetobacter orleanensis]KXV63019.1 hypothetical protein AD949_08295 [Acetobacter orleanensis]PCD78831.1 hypothetical protein CO710_10205 [Acetobacter orleanensis]GAN68826.1 hypothetical protein Abol_022_040 [Acetobacter orleanensis JCM 7639]GBR24315.1 hypothetical protein AA0473_0602 [Acetobacter orleanensis NRIC 0473]GEB83317.1 hypothetical protein AOR01nite_17940 [Acetobacter orleanensis]